MEAPIHLSAHAKMRLDSRSITMDELTDVYLHPDFQFQVENRLAHTSPGVCMFRVKLDCERLRLSLVLCRIWGSDPVLTDVITCYTQNYWIGSFQISEQWRKAYSTPPDFLFKHTAHHITALIESLESINSLLKSDLTQFTKDQWTALVNRIFGDDCEKLWAAIRQFLLLQPSPNNPVVLNILLFLKQLMMKDILSLFNDHLLRFFNRSSAQSDYSLCITGMGIMLNSISANWSASTEFSDKIQGVVGSTLTILCSKGYFFPTVEDHNGSPLKSTYSLSIIPEVCNFIEIVYSSASDEDTGLSNDILFRKCMPYAIIRCCVEDVITVVNAVLNLGIADRVQPDNRELWVDLVHDIQSPSEKVKILNSIRNAWPRFGKIRGL